MESTTFLAISILFYGSLVHAGPVLNLLPGRGHSEPAPQPAPHPSAQPSSQPNPAPHPQPQPQSNPAPQPAPSGSSPQLKPIGSEATGKTTRYWDCCKVSCGWGGKGPVTAPVTSCQKDGKTPVDKDAKSGCEGGPSFVCNSNQPWAINDNLAYGFAAVHLSGKPETEVCCACYALNFTNGPAQGKTFVVQAINTGGDLGENHFDLQMPGGGLGIFNGCTPQWGAPNDGWGKRYGGVDSKSECSQLPKGLQSGCNFRFDWFKNADNPAMKFSRVKCPAEITKKSGCQRTDE